MGGMVFKLLAAPSLVSLIVSAQDDTTTTSTQVVPDLTLIDVENNVIESRFTTSSERYLRVFKTLLKNRKIHFESTDDWSNVIDPLGKYRGGKEYLAVYLEAQSHSALDDISIAQLLNGVSEDNYQYYNPMEPNLETMSLRGSFKFHSSTLIDPYWNLIKVQVDDLSLDTIKSELSNLAHHLPDIFPEIMDPISPHGQPWSKDDPHIDGVDQRFRILVLHNISGVEDFELALDVEQNKIISRIASHSLIDSGMRPGLLLKTAMMSLFDLNDPQDRYGDIHDGTLMPGLGALDLLSYPLGTSNEIESTTCSTERNEGRLPPRLNPVDRTALGWTQPYVVNDYRMIHLKEQHNSSTSHRVAVYLPTAHRLLELQNLSPEDFRSRADVLRLRDIFKRHIGPVLFSSSRRQATPQSEIVDAGLVLDDAKKGILERALDAEREGSLSTEKQTGIQAALRAEAIQIIEAMEALLATPEAAESLLDMMDDLRRSSDITEEQIFALLAMILRERDGFFDMYFFEVREPIDSMEPCIPGDGGVMVYHVDPMVRCHSDFQDRADLEDCIASSSDGILPNGRLSPYDGTQTFPGHPNWPNIHAPIQALHVDIDRSGKSHHPHDSSLVWNTPARLLVDKMNDSFGMGYSASSYKTLELLRLDMAITLSPDLNRPLTKGAVIMMRDLQDEENPHRLRDEDLCDMQIRAARSNQILHSFSTLDDKSCVAECKLAMKSDIYGHHCSQQGYDFTNVGCITECVSELSSCEVSPSARVPCRHECEDQLKFRNHHSNSFSLFEVASIATQTSVVTGTAQCVRECIEITRNPLYWDRACSTLVDGFRPENSEDAALCLARLYGEDQCQLKSDWLDENIISASIFACICCWMLVMAFFVPLLVGDHNDWKVQGRYKTILQEVKQISEPIDGRNGPEEGG